MLLYVHVPFCTTKCRYCAFHSWPAGPEAPEAMVRYVRALRREMAYWSEALGRPEVETVYLGGGTPTILPPRLLEAVIGDIRDRFVLPSTVEFTVEGNPDSVVPNKGEMLRLLASWGVNRLSLGVQSLDDDMLALLGRPHDAAQALAAYDLARRAGFGNVSLDLIWGLPGPARLPNSAGTTGQSGLSSQGESRGAGRGTGQRLDDWLGQLARVADLGPEHISAYGLTVEPGTPLEAMLAAGRSGQPGPLDQVDRLDQRERLEGMPPDGPACPAGSPGAPGLSARSGPSAQPGSAARSGRPVLPPRLVLPDDDASAAMFLRGSEYLAGRGYAHYEISSFARPGFASRHNTGYWAGRDYLGLGPSAVSTLSAPPGLAHGAGPPILSGLPDGARARWENPRDLAAYEAAVAELGGPYPEGSGGPGGPGGPEYRPESRPAPREIEVIDRATGAAELVMLSLRTSAGLNLAAYAALAGREFLADRPGLPGLAGLIRALERDGLAVLEPGRLRLTRQGMLLSNAIIAGVLED